jgi:CRISPR/Cas system-associated exonuclease Cas4 (RecB family)
VSKIIENFQFSQTSLQSYVDCPRKFKLRYLDNLAWPAPPADPLSVHEEQKHIGERFHLLARQYFSGVPSNHLSQSINNPQLQESWKNFLSFTSTFDYQTALAEHVLTIPLEKTRLVAKFDLIALSGNQFHIFDWKTSQHLPKREVLDSRLQTIIYPFVFLRAAPSFFKLPHLKASQINFTYWFALHPDDFVTYSYTDDRDAFANRYIHDLEHQIITDIENENLFNKTDDLEKCKFCNYRSHCARGDKAGKIDLQLFIDEEDERIFEPIEFEQITEISF